MTRISICSSLALLWPLAAAPTMAAPDQGNAATTPEAKTDQARALTFEVPPEGGAYTIDVHPQILTVLHFPSEVHVAYCINGPGYAEIAHHQYSVAIRPDRRARHAGVNVTTATNHVAVLLRVVEKPEDAVLQVQFRDQDVATEIERRVSEAIAQRRVELEATLSARERRVAEHERRIGEAVRRAARQQVADGLRRRFGVRDIRHTARRDEAILRMHRAVRIGDDVHVFVSLDNRRGTPVVIHRAVFIIDRVSRRAIVALPTNGHDGALGVVKPDTKVTGVITLPGARAGKVARLRVIEKDGRRPFELGLRIEE